MSKKQMLYIRIIFFITTMTIAGILIGKALSIKYDGEVRWLQWIVGAAIVLVIAFNYLVYLLLKINLIYNKHFIYNLEKLKDLRWHLIVYLFISACLQGVFLVFLSLAKNNPTSIGITSGSDIDTAIYVVVTAFLGLSIILTFFRGWQKYKLKQKTLSEVLNNENK